VSTEDQSSDPVEEGRPAGYRYGVVFLLTLVLVVFLIVAEDANWYRAMALAIEGAALLVVIATSRARREVRRARVLAGGAAAGVLVIGAASGVLPLAVSLLLGGVLAAIIPLTLVGGLVRLVRTQGVTIQAVAGALAIYLFVGLVFAWVIGFVAYLDDGPYFAQGTDGAGGTRVYFSFTTLTTTGFGDYTAGTALGQALYLVTVIGLLVGGFAQRHRP
jgi:Ion channel